MKLKNMDIFNLIQLKDGTWWQVSSIIQEKGEYKIGLQHVSTGRPVTISGETECIASSWYYANNRCYSSPTHPRKR